MINLDILVLVSQVHLPVVGPDGLRELAHVNAHGNEVLPYLPVLVVALECLLKGAEGLVPGRQRVSSLRSSTLKSPPPPLAWNVLGGGGGCSTE